APPSVESAAIQDLRRVAFGIGRCWERRAAGRLRTAGGDAADACTLHHQMGRASYADNDHPSRSAAGEGATAHWPKGLQRGDRDLASQVRRAWRETGAARTALRPAGSAFASEDQEGAFQAPVVLLTPACGSRSTVGGEARSPRGCGTGRPRRREVLP